MAELYIPRPSLASGRLLAPLARMIVLMLPAALLALAALRSARSDALVLGIGAVVQAGVGAIFAVGRPGWKRSTGTPIVTLYLMALAWLWFGDRAEDWYNHLAKAVLVVVPLTAFACQTLNDSGAAALRRANVLARRLANRHDWPDDLAACRMLPEVKAFRAALAYDPSPALALLPHPRPAVRVAALTALEFRKDWRPGQAELVLQVAQRAEQAEVRAAAVAALGNVEDRALLETLAQFLHDENREVRHAAVEAVLWDSEKRWGWVRHAVRRVLADPLFSGDGPLVAEGQLLPLEAINDLTAWCAEKGVLSARAAQTLAAHCNRALTERPDEKLAETLRSQLSDPSAPAVFRLELGRLLQQHHELTPPVLAKLLDPSNPAPLRLIAVEVALAEPMPDPSLKSPAISALRDLARLPNREIALAAADAVQRRLGVDLGLGLGQPLPPIHSRQAADVTRRVVGWAAAQQSGEIDLAQSGVAR